MPTERQKKILKSIVELYIASAEPVGSKLLAEYADLGVSPATLRNEMAELITQGYLDQPHTSAGRVPSPRGYRLYVDELMNGYALTQNDVRELRTALQLSAASGRLISAAGRALSALTHYMAITTRPQLTEPGAIRRVEIIDCGGRSHVVVVVTETGLVRSRMVCLTSAPGAEAIRRLAGAINLVLAGVEPDCVSPAHREKLERAAGEDLAELLGLVLSFIGEIAGEPEKPEIQLSGADNLLEYPEFRDVDKAQAVLSCLNTVPAEAWLPREGAGPLEIRIGEENGADALRESSVMIVPYRLEGGYSGYIGVIGPMRMQYSQSAARLEYFARGLGAMLRDRNGLRNEGNRYGG